MNNLKNLLIDVTKPAAEEMTRLARIRGLREEDIKGMNLDAFLTKYFAKDSGRHFETDTSSEKWVPWKKWFGANNALARYVSPKDLDPFVARYVMAINRAGAFTCCSCDGWHAYSENKLSILLTDRYSKIWHGIIASFLKDDHGIHWEINDRELSLKLPKSDEGKIKAYLALNKMAEEIERLGPQLLDLKERMVDKMRGETKDTLSDEAIDCRMKAVVEDLLKEHPFQ